MPLVALKNGVKKYAYQLEETDRHSQDYSCPICKDHFSVVLPIKDFSRIPHFRHRTEKYHGEPETQDHMNMKNYFYMTAKELGLNAELEVKIINDFTHIADVVIHYNDKKLHTKGIAIECQCSSISVDEILERNATYLFNGYTPVWVFGPDYYERASQEKYQQIRKVEKELYEHHQAIFYYYSENIIWSEFDYSTEWKGVYTMNGIIDFNSFLKTVSGESLSNRIEQNDLSPENRIGAYYYDSNDSMLWIPLINYPFFEISLLKHNGQAVGKIKIEIDKTNLSLYDKYSLQEYNSPIKITFINAFLARGLTQSRPYRWLKRELPQLQEITENGTFYIWIDKNSLNTDYLRELIKKVGWVFSKSTEI